MAEQATEPRVGLTEAAAARFLSIRPSPTAALRVSLAPSGCAGFAHKIEFFEPAEGTEGWVPASGPGSALPVWAQGERAAWLDGLTVGWARDGLGERVAFENPRVQSECGCGESVGFGPGGRHGS